MVSSITQDPYSIIISLNLASSVNLNIGAPRVRPSYSLVVAIGELVGYKPCATLAASWWVSGDGQCRDETQ